MQYILDIHEHIQVNNNSVTDVALTNTLIFITFEMYIFLKVRYLELDFKVYTLKF